MTTVTAQKLCKKCGRDVTHERRLKDAHGHYWCSDCGAGNVDSATTSSGLISPCPRCHAPTHATHMIRKNGVYVCEACASGVKRSKKRGGSDAGHTAGGGGAVAVAAISDEDRAKRNKAILGVALIVVGVALYFFMNAA